MKVLKQRKYLVGHYKGFFLKINLCGKHEVSLGLPTQPSHNLGRFSVCPDFPKSWGPTQLRPGSKKCCAVSSTSDFSGQTEAANLADLCLNLPASKVVRAINLRMNFISKYLLSDLEILTIKYVFISATVGLHFSYST